MHTFKKLPTMQPKTKKTSDQNCIGTAAQTSGSKMRDMSQMQNGECGMLTAKPEIRMPKPEAQLTEVCSSICFSDFGTRISDFGPGSAIHIPFERSAHPL